MAEPLTVLQLEEDLRQLLGIPTSTSSQSDVVAKQSPEGGGSSDRPTSHSVNVTQQSQPAKKQTDQKSKRAERRKANKEKSNVAPEASAKKDQTRNTTTKPEEVKSWRQRPGTGQQQSENIHPPRIFTRTGLDQELVETQNNPPNANKKMPVTKIKENPPEQSGAIALPSQPVKLLPRAPVMLSSVANGAESALRLPESKEISSENKPKIEGAGVSIGVQNPVKVEEEMVRIVVPPPPQNQKSRKKRREKTEVKLKEDETASINKVQEEK